uniref:hypothetical protein n=1 Tax=Paractinoplanes polyasparticus TaxID=2856853 RepID=UPI001C85B132|nr:hypothetical protein [Actinoplanes polyasparticus]
MQEVGLLDARLIGNLVWAAGARSVVDVRVAGELVVAGGEALRSDRHRARAEVRAIAVRLRQPVDASRG